MTTRLTTLLQKYAHLQRPISLKHIEDLLRQEKFTGSITFHYRGGTPLRVEAGRPLTVPLLTEGGGCQQAEDLTTEKT